MTPDKIEKLKHFMSLVKKGVTQKELEQFLHLVLSVVKETKDSINALPQEHLQKIEDAVVDIHTLKDSALLQIDLKTNELLEQAQQQISLIRAELARVKALKVKPGKDGSDGKDGEDGKDGKSIDESKIIKAVVSKIKIPEPKEIEPVEIVNLLESLTDDKRLDASAIKNLPIGGGWKGGGSRYLRNLADVKITNIADADVIKWDEATQQFVNGVGGTIDGSGTTNQIAYWTDSDTLGSLTTATYPSLTELAYVKGVTSAIQTQIDAKQATLVSGTNIKTINSTSLLGSGDITIATGITIGDTVTDGTATRLLYLGASNVLAQTGGTVYLSSDNLYFDQTGTGNSQDTKSIFFKPTYTDGSVQSTFGITTKGIGGNTYPEMIIGGLASGLAKIRIRSLSGAGETIYFHANDLDFSNVSSAILMPKLFLCNPGESPPGSEKLFLRSTSNIVMAIFEQADPNANPVEITYIHNNPWTGGASNGAFQSIRLRTDTTDRMLAANWTGTWADATHASRKGRATFNVYDTAIREGLRIEASGSAPMVGLYGTAAVIQATTAGGASTFTANTSGIADDTATFDGYTLGQVVKALRDIGVLA